MAEFTSLKKIAQRIKDMGRKPDFQNILSICKQKKPSRPTLFEFIICDRFLEILTGDKAPLPNNTQGWCNFLINGFHNAGYDYAVIGGWDLNTLIFPSKDVQQKASKSLNEGAVITDRKSYEQYAWPVPVIPFPIIYR